MEKVFLEELMENIIESTKVPKVQVERIVGQLLSLFIADIITEKFKNIPKYSGGYELVLPEFPLKKSGNNQSTNIDYLLFNKEKKIIVFLELKTDSTSIDLNQLRIYSNYSKPNPNDIIKLLYEDINLIKSNSTKNDKYNYLIERIEPYNKFILDVDKFIIVYFVPLGARRHLREIIKKDPSLLIDRFLSFSHLPNLRNHKYSKEWMIIKKHLSRLDKN